MHERDTDLERSRLHQLDGALRAAIATSLMNDLPHLAVALDVARDLIERVLEESQPTKTRVAVACAHAELALKVWSETIDATLAETAVAQA